MNSQRKWPIVSIIIPVFNAERYLRRCLDSIISQTYNKLDIVIINDGSSDNSGIILNEYNCKDERIKIITQNNAGEASARQTGIGNASGDYISFVDADDWIDLDYVETLVEPILNEIEIDIVSTNYCKEYNNISIPRRSEEKNGKRNKNDMIRLIYSLSATSLGVWGHIYRKDIIKQKGLFTNFMIGTDVDAMWKVVNQIKNGYYVNKNSYHYCKNQYSITGSRRYSDWRDSVIANYHLTKSLMNDIYIGRRIKDRYLTYFIKSVRVGALYDKERFLSLDRVESKDLIIHHMIKECIKDLSVDDLALWIDDWFLRRNARAVDYYEELLGILGEYSRRGKIYIYGAGENGLSVKGELTEFGIRTDGFIVSNEHSRISVFDDVEPIFHLSEIDTDSMVIVSGSISNCTQFIKNLKAEGMHEYCLF